MTKFLTMPHMPAFRCDNLQLGRFFVLLGLLLPLAACQPDGADKNSQALPTPSEWTTEAAPAVVKATATPAFRFPPTSSPTPQPTMICVPSSWRDIVIALINELTLPDAVQQSEVIECGDPAAEIDQGRVSMALVQGNQGIQIGSARLALVVPFGSSQEPVTIDQARQILDQGSSSIEVVDWREVTPEQIVLRVDGSHPGDADYPLLQAWSILAVPKYESVATILATALSGIMSGDRVVTLAAAGDVMLDRKLGDLIASGWVEYPFEDVADILSSADLAIGNLESALGDRGEAADKDYTFQAPPEAALALEHAGFDLLSLANNHALDFGASELVQGIDLLREHGIVTVGAGVDETSAHMPFITEIGGLRLAFLAYVDVPVEWRGFDARSWAATPTRAGVAWADPERIRNDVGDATLLADLVIVLLHSGNEFIYEPSAVQVTAAHTAIEAGAQLVLGHHAHVAQGIEFYAGGVIAYGLGNLAFAGGGAQNSVILNIWLDAEGVRSLEVVPLLLLADGHPTPAAGAQATLIRQLFYELSSDLR